jgi:hypothetical protein
VLSDLRYEAIDELESENFKSQEQQCLLVFSKIDKNKKYLEKQIEKHKLMTDNYDRTKDNISQELSLNNFEDASSLDGEVLTVHGTSKFKNKLSSCPPDQQNFINLSG